MERNLTPLATFRQESLEQFHRRCISKFQGNVMATGAKRSGATLCFSAAETKGGSTSLAMTALIFPDHIYEKPAQPATIRPQTQQHRDCGAILSGLHGWDLPQKDTTHHHIPLRKDTRHGRTGSQFRSTESAEISR
jgi:hypothetical protein